MNINAMKNWYGKGKGLTWVFSLVIISMIMMALIVPVTRGGSLGAADNMADGEVIVKGLALTIAPANQMVPLNTPVKVKTLFSVERPELSRGMVVKGELKGPGLLEPVTLSTLPNHPFNVPGLTVTGEYYLENIRLEREGRVLLAGEPASVSIEVMDIVVTRVETRPLSLAEIRDKGIVITEKNFTAYNFSVGFKLESEEVVYEFPVIYTPQGAQLLPGESSGGGGFTPPGVGSSSKIPFSIKIPKINLPDISGAEEEVTASETSTIPGLLIFNNDIAFLNQYFSVMFIVSNNAPQSSNLGLTNLKATLELPGGLREAETNPPKIQGAAIPVHCPGPDGKIGTADDLEVIIATYSGMAEFLAEGVKTGRHLVKVNFSGTLTGVPGGDVEINGSATGMVIVRNPTFSVTFSHPHTVRMGEEYDIYVTVANTSSVTANLVSLTMPASRLVGTQLLSEESVSFETIAPGESQVATYHMLSLETGEVNASAFAAEGNVTGIFELRAGVGEKGIPLSPDTLRLPGYAYYLPGGVVDYSQRLLGEAYSIATTPPGGLPGHLPYIDKNIIKERVQEMAAAGQRIMLGDDGVNSIHIMTLDWLGNESPDIAFDILRRLTTKGRRLAEQMALVMNTKLASGSPLEFHQQLAETCSYKQPFVSVLLAFENGTRSGELKVYDRNGNSLLFSGSSAIREIPYSEFFHLQEVDQTPVDMVMIGHVDVAADSFRIDIMAEQANGVDLSIILPGVGGGFRQVVFKDVMLETGSISTVMVELDGSEFVLSCDTDHDGNVDMTYTGEVTGVTPPPLKLISATQDCRAHPAGHAVALFFNRPVKVGDASITENFSVTRKNIYGAFPQPGGRVLLLGLDNAISPFVESRVMVKDLHDQAGNPLVPGETEMPVTATIKVPGGIVYGQVLDAWGQPVSHAEVHLVEVENGGLSSLGDASVTRSYTYTDSNGNYQFDYVRLLQESFAIEVKDAGTGKVERVRSKLSANGQRFRVDIVMRGRGSIAGRVIAEDGRVIAGASINAKAESNTTQEFFSVVSNEKGEFLIKGVPVGRTQLVAVKGKLQGMATTEVSLGGMVGMVDITVASGKTGNVTGRVLQHDGVTPVAYAYVALGNGSITFFATRTDSEGGFRFENVPVGGVELLAYDPMTANLGGKVNGQLLENQEFNGTIIFRGVGKIRGKVLSFLGIPQQGVLVAVNGTPFYMNSDNNGEFFFDQVPVGSHTVLAYLLDGNSIGQAVKIYGEDEQVQVVFILPDTRTGRVMGKVYEANGVMVMPGVDVFLCTGNYIVIDQVRSGLDGSYTFNNVPRGQYIVAVVVGERGTANTAVVQQANMYPSCDLQFRGTGKIVVRVLAPDGETGVLANVTLARPVFKFVQGDMIGFVGSNSTSRTNAQGIVEFNNVVTGSFSVEAKNSFYPQGARKSGVLVNPGEQVDVSLVMQSSATPGKIEVQVVDYKNEKVSAALVTLTDSQQGKQNLSTDSNGLVTFTLVPEGGFTVEAQYNNYKGIRYGSMGYEGGLVKMTVGLKGKGKVIGTVKDSSGNVVNGAVVVLQGMGYPFERFETRCSPDGKFIFANVTEGSIVLSAFDDVLTQLGGRAEGTLAGHGTVMEIEVFLEASGMVSGQVKGPDGVVVVGNAQVVLYHTGYPEPVGFAVTGSEGDFSFSHIPVGGVRVEVFDGVSGRKGRASGSINFNNDHESLVVNLEARGVVSGVFYRGDGVTPIPGAIVTLESLGQYRIQVDTMTNLNGQFRFSQVGEGDFQCEAKDPASGLIGKGVGHLGYEGEVVLVDLYAQGAGVVKGVVRNADNTPAPHARVRLYRDRIYETTADGNGNYSLSFIPLGHFSLTAFQEGGIDKGRAMGDIHFNGEEAQIDIVFNGLGGVRVRVMDESHAWMPGMVVKVNFDENKSKSPSVQGDGEYYFSGIPVGVFQVEVSHSNSAINVRAYKQGEITVAGQEVELLLTVAAAVRVTGLVRMGDGSTPAEAARVKYSGEGFTLYEYTDGGGRFEFPAVKTGAYTIEIEGLNNSGKARMRGTLSGSGGDVDFPGIVLDSMVPKVNQTVPEDGSVGVVYPLVSPVTVVFSEPMDGETVNGTNVKCTANGVVLTKQLSLSSDGRVLTVTPTSAWQSFVLYSITLTTGVTDRAGNGLASPYRFSFTTVDKEAPRVVSIVPAANAEQVATETVIAVVFNEPVDGGSFSSGQFRLSLNGGVVAGEAELVQGNKGVQFRPVQALLTDSVYTVTISDMVDMSGNRQQVAFTSTFKTRDTVAPVITLSGAANNTVFIEGEALDFEVLSNDTDIAAVYFFINGQLGKGVTERPYKYRCKAPLIAESGNQFVLEAYARDRAGNTGNREVRDYRLQQDTPPHITFTPPSSNEVLPGGTINCAIQASDDVQLAVVTLTASAPVNFNDTRTMAQKTFSRSYAIGVPRDAVPGSLIVLHAEARDSRGYIVLANDFTVGIPRDENAPGVTIVSPVANARFNSADPQRNRVNIDVQVDENVGLQYVDIYVADERVVRLTQPPYRTVYEVLPQTEEREIVVKAEARDLANLTGTAQVNVILERTVDPEAPQVFFMTPTVGSLVFPGEQLVLRAKAEDENGIDRVEFYLGEQLLTTDSEAPYEAIYLVPGDIAPGALLDLKVVALDRMNKTNFHRVTVAVIQGEYEVLGNGTTVAGDDYRLEGKTVVIKEGTVFINGTHHFNDILVKENGILSHTPVDLDNEYEMELTAVGKIVVGGNARVDVNSCGYLGGFSGANNSMNGRTLGNGVGSYQYSGGSYGGLGGQWAGNHQLNEPYGSPYKPVQAGSGGGGSALGNHGGNGGGVIGLTAVHLVLDGTISADGGRATLSSAGGSGGAIRIETSVISGTGYIRANGGGSDNYGCGGGGRIAVYYVDDSAYDFYRVTATGGQVLTSGGANYSCNGSAGTVYLEKQGEVGQIIIDNRGIEADRDTNLASGAPGTITALTATVMTDDGANFTPGSLVGMVLQPGIHGVDRFIIIDNTRTTVEVKINGKSLLDVAQVGDSYRFGHGGRLTIENSSSRLQGDVCMGEVIVDNARLVVDGELTVDRLHLINSSVLTHSRATVLAVYGLSVDAGEVLVDETSQIDVSGRGYVGGKNSGNENEAGYTFGNTFIGGSARNAGGSHGGVGAYWGEYMPAGSYSSIYQPHFPGSGGGGFDTNNAGGNGGGVVRIKTGELILEGVICANGDSIPQTRNGGAGAGGSILLETGIIRGNGKIQAHGGDSYLNSSGGGGRIALYYENGDDFDLQQVTAWGGKHDNPTATDKKHGGAGSVYLKGKNLDGILVINNRDLAPKNPLIFPVIQPGVVTGISVDGLTLENASAKYTPGSLVDMTLIPDMEQPGVSVVIVGNTKTSITVDRSLVGLTSVNKTYGGKLIFNGNIEVNHATTALGGSVEVKNVTVTGNSILTHPASMMETYSLSLKAAGKIRVDSGSRMSADNMGYAGGYSGINSNENGRTIGNTTTGGSNRNSGGSHGGLGGQWGTLQVSPVYGSLYDPSFPGSGGGGYSAGYPGGNGGGVLRLQGLTIEINGIISANGGVASPGTEYGGSGAGGSIRLDTDVLEGTGEIQANGGNCQSRCGGSGGRIAIYYGEGSGFNFNNVSAMGGKRTDLDNPKNNGGAGTVFLKEKGVERGRLVVDNRGIATINESTPLPAVGSGSNTGLGANFLENTSAVFMANSLTGIKLNPNPVQSALFTVTGNTGTRIFTDAADGDMTLVGSVSGSYIGEHWLLDLTVRGKARVSTRDRVLVSGNLSVSADSLYIPGNQ